MNVFTRTMWRLIGRLLMFTPLRLQYKAGPLYLHLCYGKSWRDPDLAELMTLEEFGRLEQAFIDAGLVAQNEA